jgi:uncharacterized phage protein (TIGR02220 family)
MILIHKTKHEKNFTMVPNTIFEDKNLSLKATGILIYAISKPLDWRLRVSDIINHFTEGRDAVYSGIKELEEQGYLVKVREQDKSSGKFTEVVYHVYDSPRKGKKITRPLTENQEVEPLTENPTYSNTDIYNNNNNISNTNNAKPSASAFSYEEFLELFNQRVGSQHRGDTKSKGSFKARIKEGYTRDDFELAITNAKKDRYLMGENDSNRRYLTPEYITRSEKLDFWINSKKKGTGPGGLKWN